LPIFEIHGALAVYGLRKVWSYDPERQSYKEVYNYNSMLENYSNKKETGLRIQNMNFLL